ncbi:MAG TPA: 6,7-dimethyl-8-ribityllumazine synthase [Nitrospira sp.]|jgi:6,7-dimethyl-8-ribityllumazine synthase|nr:6,7-dimethyl-8-ribityllumazine synthase [Nitrospira sp.]
MKSSKGLHRATGLKFGIVAAKFNQSVTGKLLSSCLAGLARHGIKDSQVEVVRVPGAFEIPLVAKTLADSGRFDAVICLGAVIQGDTPHFDYICAEVSRGIGQAALDTGVPIVFGVLTTETVAQAVERADPAKFNRGGEAAKVAIEMVTVLRRINTKEPQAHRVGSALRSRRVVRKHGT